MRIFSCCCIFGAFLHGRGLAVVVQRYHSEDISRYQDVIQKIYQDIKISFGGYFKIWRHHSADISRYQDIIQKIYIKISRYHSPNLSRSYLYSERVSLRFVWGWSGLKDHREGQLKHDIHYASCPNKKLEVGTSSKFYFIQSQKSPTDAIHLHDRRLFPGCDRTALVFPLFEISLLNIALLTKISQRAMSA